MDRMLYIGMAGAREVANAQGVVSNNLANANTAGFRADLHQLQSQSVYGPGFPSRAYAGAESPGADLSPAAPIPTGRDLDVAIQGQGWIAVQAPDGNEAYTRAGDMQVSAGGILTNGAGHPVLGNAGPVALPPADKVEIGQDGTISIKLLGQDNMAVLDRIKLTRPPDEQMHKGDDGLFRLADGEEADADHTVTLVSGALESSNVNGVESLVQMMKLARLFELQVKVMKEAERTDEAASMLVRPA
ncbi:flagellar basal body rod protein FlgF [Thioalkalicoccus limnaeus]|uniref:Flagellar basal-body rod protein FlgF n=1 Tax=Thioalkalicoccus limnaeus TaxID=120681 RepID=A0ABV4BBM6_9GAMM